MHTRRAPARLLPSHRGGRERCETFMRFGIPLLGDRVAPRCTCADTVLVVTARHRRTQDQALVPLEGNTWADLATVLTEQGVNTLVCGGISPETRESVRARDIAVIENVAGTRDEILDAVRRERIHPGFGLGPVRVAEDADGRRDLAPPVSTAAATGDAGTGGLGRIDCLACRDRVCLRGVPCPHVGPPPAPPPGAHQALLEAGWDVALEKERTLCRLAEVVYFALEMGCRKVGVAFCVDLEEPAAILTGVLRRFFNVVPVCCRVGGIGAPAGGPADGVTETVCDPSGMARALSAAGTELNILVGLCVGVDHVFHQTGSAPATTLFVKDKSLANNPIGALYSHYYLKDI